MDIKETFQHGGKQKRYVNTYKTGYSEDIIEISFAETVSEQEVSVASTIRFHPEMLPSLIYSLIGLTMAYQEKYKDLKFKIVVEDDEDGEEGIEND